MPRQVVQTDLLTYTVSPDGQLLPGDQLSALAGVHLTDELTGRAPDGHVSIDADIAYSSRRIAEGGIAGVVGIPRRAFPALASSNYTANLTVTVDGFVPVAVPIAVGLEGPPNPFPQRFTPPPLAEVALHRQPIVFTGRVMQSSGAGLTPGAGATVAITGIWRTPPTPTSAPAPDAPDIVSLRPALYAARTAAAGTLTAQSLTPIVGDDKTLTAYINVGDNPVGISNSNNLNVGDVVVIDPDDVYLSEYLAIKSIVAGSTPSQPAAITLGIAPSIAHRLGAIVRKVTPGALAPAVALAQDAIAGDACVFLVGVGGLTPSQQAAITSGADPAEYHAVLLFSAVADADGYYVLPPFSRVAQVKIRAALGALGQDVVVQPDYSLTENRLDFLVS